MTRVFPIIQAFLSSLRVLGQATADFVFPPCCEFCHANLDPSSPLGLPLCSACISVLSPPVENSCNRCGAPAGPFLDVTLDCIYCRGDRFFFDTLCRLNVYRDELQKAILRCQQANGIPLTAALTKLLSAQEAAWFQTRQWDWILPVPQHWTQRLKRPHHPPIIMAEVLSKILKVPWSPHILKKVAKTPPQSHLSPAQRRLNLRRAFRVGKHGLAPVRGAAVLIVDDVLTTGTTASRTAQTLKAAGAATVGIVVLARGLGQV